MEFVTAELTALARVSSAIGTFAKRILVNVRDTLIYSVTNCFLFNALLLIIGGFVIVTGLWVQYNQVEIMTTLDKIQECGAPAFGVDFLPFSLFDLEQIFYIVPSVLRIINLEWVMGFNSILVYLRQVAVDFFTAVTSGIDFRNPLAIFQLLFQFVQSALAAVNFLIFVARLQQNPIASFINAALLFVECFIQLLSLLALSLVSFTTYSENCNICQYNTEIAPRTCILSTITLSTEIGFSSSANCSATNCNNFGCDFAECIGFGLNAISEGLLLPCLGIDLGPSVDALTTSLCCLSSIADRSLFIVLGVAENLITGGCLDLTTAIDQVDALISQVVECIDDVICIITGGNYCNFLENLIAIFEYIINVIAGGIEALVNCGSATCGSTTISQCFENWPGPLPIPSSFFPLPSPGMCRTGDFGFHNCFQCNFDCLITEPLWAPLEPVFDAFIEALRFINNAICGVLCLGSFMEDNCIFIWFTDPCPTTPSDFELQDCTLQWANCVLGFPPYPIVSVAINGIVGVSVVLQDIICQVYGVGTCIDDTLAAPVCNGFLGLLDPFCIGELFSCLLLFLPTASKTNAQFSSEAFNFTIPTELLKLYTSSVYQLFYENAQELHDLSQVTQTNLCIDFALSIDYNECLNGCLSDSSSCSTVDKREEWKSSDFRFSKFQEHKGRSHQYSDIVFQYCGAQPWFNKQQQKFNLQTIFSVNEKEISLAGNENKVDAFYQCAKKILKKERDMGLSKGNGSVRPFIAKAFSEKFNRGKRSIFSTLKPDYIISSYGKSKEEKRELLQWQEENPDTCTVDLSQWENGEYLRKAVSKFDGRYTQDYLKQLMKQLYGRLKKSVTYRFISSVAKLKNANMTDVLKPQCSNPMEKSKDVYLYDSEYDRFELAKMEELCDCHMNIDTSIVSKKSGEIGCEFIKKATKNMYYNAMVANYTEQFTKEFYNRDNNKRKYSASIRENPLLKSLRERSNKAREKRPFSNVAENLKHVVPSKKSIDQWRMRNSAVLGKVGLLADSTVLTNFSFCWTGGISFAYQRGTIKRPEKTLWEYIDLHSQKERYEPIVKAVKSVDPVMKTIGAYRLPIIKQIHMFVHSILSGEIKKLYSYYTGDLYWNPDTATFVEYPYEIPKPSGPAVWNGDVEINLGILFTGLTLNSFLSLLGINFSSNNVNYQQNTSVLSFRNWSESLYDTSLVNLEPVNVFNNVSDTFECMKYNDYFKCVQWQRKLFVADSPYKVFNEPNRLFATSEERMKSRKTYLEYKKGLASDPATFDEDSYFLEKFGEIVARLFNFINSVLGQIFGFGEIDQNFFINAVESVEEVVADIDAGKEFGIIVNKLSEQTACVYPRNVNGSTLYNPFCFPALPATLGGDIVPLPVGIFAPKLPWPEELIVTPCRNIYNGNTVVPGTSDTFINQNPLEAIVKNITTFRFSNNCNTSSQFGTSVLVNAIQGTFAVGAAQELQGVVYVFPIQIPEFPPIQITQKIWGNNKLEGELFGYSLDGTIDGSLMIVGAPLGNKYTGYARIFERNGAMWVNSSDAQRDFLNFTFFENDITIVNLQGNSGYSSFGNAVLINDEHAFVAAKNSNTSAGVVYVYYNNGSLYVPVQIPVVNSTYPVYNVLKDPVQPSYAQFGSSLAMDKLDKQYLIVGENMFNDSIGLIQVFKKSGIFYNFYQTIQYPDLPIAFVTPVADRPTFGTTVTMANGLSDIFCASSPGGFGRFDCFRLIAGSWSLIITEIGGGAGGFAIGLKMNSTHILSTEKNSNFLFVYEFDPGYTGVTLVDTFIMDSSVAGDASIALDFTTDFGGAWITGQPSIGQTVYGNFAAGTQPPLIFSNDGQERPFCNNDPPCDYCEQIYRSCREYKFTGFLATGSFLLASIPAVANFFFLDGLPLTTVTNIVLPQAMFRDYIGFVLLASRILFPCFPIPPTLQFIFTPINTLVSYVWIYALSIIWGTSIPFAWPIIITILSGWIGFEILNWLNIPLIGTVLKSVNSATNQAVFISLAVLFIGQITVLFIKFTGWTFSINQILIDFLDTITNTSFIFQYFDIFAIVRAKLAFFVYDNPAQVPFVDQFCFVFSYVDIGYVLVAIPFFVFLAQLLWRSAGDIVIFIQSMASALWLILTIGFVSFFGEN